MCFDDFVLDIGLICLELILFIIAFLIISPFLLLIALALPSPPVASAVILQAIAEPVDEVAYAL